MGYDGVASVYNLGIVAALVEHTHIYAQVVCQIYRAVHGAFIRADHHQMLLVDLCGSIVGEQCFYKLIRRQEVVKAVKGDGILHSGVMSIKGNDVFYAHCNQLLQCHSTV